MSDERGQTALSRRTLLATLTATSVGIAGCTGAEDQGGQGGETVEAPAEETGAATEVQRTVEENLTPDETATETRQEGNQAEETDRVESFIGMSPNGQQVYDAIYTTGPDDPANNVLTIRSLNVAEIPDGVTTAEIDEIIGQPRLPGVVEIVGDREDIKYINQDRLGRWAVEGKNGQNLYDQMDREMYEKEVGEHEHLSRGGVIKGDLEEIQYLGLAVTDEERLYLADARILRQFREEVEDNVEATVAGMNEFVGQFGTNNNTDLADGGVEVLEQEGSQYIMMRYVENDSGSGSSGDVEAVDAAGFRFEDNRVIVSEIDDLTGETERSDIEREVLAYLS